MTANTIETDRRQECQICRSENLLSVPLPDFPTDLELPAELANRFWFDQSNQKLVFRGFMSKATFDRLQALHRDLKYQRALQEMFRRSTARYQQLETPGRIKWSRLAWTAVTLLLVVLALSALWW